MNRFGLLVALVLAGSSVATAPVASAESCASHLAKHATTKQADIAYHAVHGGESPCKESSSSSGSSSNSGDYNRRHRDRFGFHCTWRGCG